MATKLDNITGQYHRYVEDQLLTHYQLNETIDFFEDQNRLHNVYLHGTGIVCGFRTSFAGNGGGIQSITITQGTGITTDGDVIKLRVRLENTDLENVDIATKQKLYTVNFDHLTYKSFKEFDPDKANYPRFLDTSNILFPIWELLPEKTGGLESGEALLSAFSGDLKNHVILLYLENYTKDQALCTATDCSNLGGEQVFNIRVLVVEQAIANLIKVGDTIISAKPDCLDKLDKLPELGVKKIPLSAVNSANAMKLRKAFNEVVGEVAFKNQLLEGLAIMLDEFGYSNENAEIIDGFNTLLVVDEASVDEHVFYLYDLLKDITATYMEMKDLFIQLCCKCNPDLHAFPKHLFLGLVGHTPDNEAFRHKFYKAPYLGDGHKIYKNFHSLVNRLVLLFKNYAVGKDEVKITPSRFYGKLGAKSIPWYYKADEDFLSYWDFDKTEGYNPRANFGYDAAFLKPDAYITDTLAFCLTDLNFFRVESYLTLKPAEIDAFLTEKKKAFGLDFDYLILDLADKDKLGFLIGKNPSFEHLCGVKRGGTLLFLKEGDTIIADFSIVGRAVVLEEIFEEECGCFSIAECFRVLKPAFLRGKGPAKSPCSGTNSKNCAFIRFLTLMVIALMVMMILCCSKCSCSHKNQGVKTIVSANGSTINDSLQ